MKLLQKPNRVDLLEQALARSGTSRSFQLLRNDEIASVREAFISSTGMHAPAELSQFKHQILFFVADNGFVISGDGESGGRTVFNDVELIAVRDLSTNNGVMETKLMKLKHQEKQYRYQRLVVRSTAYDHKFDLNKRTMFAVTPVDTLINEEDDSRNGSTFLYLKRLAFVTVNRFVNSRLATLIAKTVDADVSFDQSLDNCIKAVDNLVTDVGHGIASAESKLLKRNVIHDGRNSYNFNLIQRKSAVKRGLIQDLRLLKGQFFKCSTNAELIAAIQGFESESIVKKYTAWLQTAHRMPSQILKHEFA